MIQELSKRARRIWLPRDAVRIKKSEKTDTCYTVNPLKGEGKVS
jgi:hypothetical protein